MTRREMFFGSTALAVGTLAAKAAAQQHEHHAGTAANQNLITTASNCVSAGEVCMHHCHEVAAKGDHSLIVCAERVNELIAACTALRSLAAQSSSFLPKYAKLTSEVCKSSEAECRKFEKLHPECKACADACVACITECSRVA
ncbi:MAG TPA: four-helix bundle copper-binding protein [Candidatus Binatia bacterium]|nr:four-helix bundle copper-binding protein [Candidatus Binatia bacterium]